MLMYRRLIGGAKESLPQNDDLKAFFKEYKGVIFGSDLPIVKQKITQTIVNKVQDMFAGIKLDANKSVLEYANEFGSLVSQRKFLIKSSEILSSNMPVVAKCQKFGTLLNVDLKIIDKLFETKASGRIIWKNDLEIDDELKNTSKIEAAKVRLIIKYVTQVNRQQLTGLLKNVEDKIKVHKEILIKYLENHTSIGANYRSSGAFEEIMALLSEKTVDKVISVEPGKDTKGLVIKVKGSGYFKKQIIELILSAFGKDTKGPVQRDLVLKLDRLFPVENLERLAQKLRQPDKELEKLISKDGELAQAYEISRDFGEDYQPPEKRKTFVHSAYFTPYPQLKGLFEKQFTLYQGTDKEMEMYVNTEKLLFNFEDVRNIASFPPHLLAIPREDVRNYLLGLHFAYYYPLQYKNYVLYRSRKTLGETMFKSGVINGVTVERKLGKSL